MQIGSVILQYNRNKEKPSFLIELLNQLKLIDVDFSIIYILPNQIKNTTRKWKEVLLYLTKL